MFGQLRRGGQPKSDVETGDIDGRRWTTVLHLLSSGVANPELQLQSTARHLVCSEQADTSASYIKHAVPAGSPHLALYVLHFCEGRARAYKLTTKEVQPCRRDSYVRTLLTNGNPTK